MDTPAQRVRLVGCDFSSSPSQRKPIVLAWGDVQAGCVTLRSLQSLPTLEAFAHWLQQSGAWVGGFDLPFGLPRALVQALQWPQDWAACMTHYAQLSRAEIRQHFKAFCDARPVGSKFAHRACDGPAGSSPSMKWVNPPVAYMLHAGVPLLRAAQVYFPGLQAPPVTLHPAPKVALEAYPGLLARETVGSRSYKSDDKTKHTPERLIARKDVVEALEMGRTRLQLRLRLTHAQRDALTADPSGDSLDAVLCLMQAAWAQVRSEQGDTRYGLPEKVDSLEGWIVTA